MTTLTRRGVTPVRGDFARARAVARRWAVSVLPGTGCLLLLLQLAAAGAAPAAQELRTPLSEPDVRHAKSLVDQMRADPRGPYLRLRWHCADGTVHPPAGTPCRQRGGGVQFAELGEAAGELAAVGIYTGTILQGLEWDAFLDKSSDHHRLKAYLIEHYLSEVDNGWVLRRARYYRGARQIEDEEKQGQAFLERLLSDPDWTRRHFLLATQLVSVVPHLTPGRQASTPTIRNLATDLAGLDQRFQTLRVKIHSFPSQADLVSVEAALAAAGPDPALVRETLGRLRDELRLQYDETRLARQLSWYQERLGAPLAEEIAGVHTAHRLDRMASVTRLLRSQVTSSADGRRNLILMDLNHLLLERAFVLAQQAEREPVSRHRRLEQLGHFVGLAMSAGFLSTREYASIASDLDWLQRNDTLTALDYKTRLDLVAASVDWSVATVNQVFGASAHRYGQVEPKAVGFLDSLIRGSMLLPLANQVDELKRDLNQFLGQSHVVLGERVDQGVAGLNPGVALRPLELLDPGQGPYTFDATKIYVLRELPSEMGPVAGVLTVDQGNLLSHVQLLARNLAIPNASIPGSLLPRLEQYRGQVVFFAVTPFGQVVLKPSSEITPAERDLVDDGRAARSVRVALDTARLRLEDDRPVPLSELRASDAGVIVGPKAANLGELARRFPGHVAGGLALPFGMYRQHVDRPYESGRTLFEEIQWTLRQAEQLGANGYSEDEADRITLERLAQLRQAIVDLEWIPEMRRTIVDAMRQTFGNDLHKGVFVRSDTNAEDLPQFTGAGLNLTVPHQTTEESVLAAIKAVWASPLRDRPYRWRKQILSNQEHVYPSVLLLESVPSEKSGVLITSGLQVGGADSLTIVVAEGVGGAVDGEPAETLLVDPSGEVRLLSQAKSPYHRELVTDGGAGVRWVASSKNDTLLDEEEVSQLVGIVREWHRVSPPSPQSVWDIEFGFAGGQLWLFQVRPFVPYRSLQLYQQLQALDTDVLRRANRPIDLTEIHAAR